MSSRWMYMLTERRGANREVIDVFNGLEAARAAITLPGHEVLEFVASWSDPENFMETCRKWRTA